MPGPRSRSASARIVNGVRPRLRPGQEKRAARGCKRPKSREETPKEGGGKREESRYRAATICQCVAQKARGIDLFLGSRLPAAEMPWARPDADRVRRRTSLWREQRLAMGDDDRQVS